MGGFVDVDELSTSGLNRILSVLLWKQRSDRLEICIF